MEERDDERRAVLWEENRSNITHRGHVTLNGRKHYAVLVNSLNAEGQKKHELMVSAGLIYANEDKLNERSPDFSGPVTIGTDRFQIALWDRQAKSGNNYLQGQLGEPKRNETFPE